MYFQVFFEGGLIRGTERALLAAEGLPPSVGPHVVLQRRRIRGHEGTLPARKRLLPSVCSQMFAQISAILGSVSTKRTIEDFVLVQVVVRGRDCRLPLSQVPLSGIVVKLKEKVTSYILSE